MEMRRAPARGRYDRGRSRAERFREQHFRLLAATVRAALAGTETVTTVVALAGVGRSTFHEFFDDFPHALRAARDHAVRVMRAALAATAADERWVEGLLRAWIDVVRAEPELALVTLRVSGDRSLSELGSIIAEALGAAVRSDASERDTLMELRLRLAAAAAEGCARDLARQALTQSDAAGIDVEQVKHLLVATVQSILTRPPRDKI